LFFLYQIGLQQQAELALEQSPLVIESVDGTGQLDEFLIE